jgi:ATP-dependent helicase/nuclease subunit A
MTVIDVANAEQRAASDPKISAFVAASAGSGKTKLLTDRLLRLMLAGTPPEKILCLTYTKAAAAEMMIRLNRRLGKWVVMPEAKLAEQLRDLDVPADKKNLALARKIFADVLDLPGGMRIGTIHAFCQSLLRRFPLEAGLSPHFEVADDSDASLRLREARETVLADVRYRDAILPLAAETDEQKFAALTEEFSRGQADLLQRFSAGDVVAMQRAALGAGEDRHDDLGRAAVNWPRETHIAAVLRRIQERGNPSGKSWAFERLSWLAHEAENRFLAWEHWVAGHFTAAGTRRKMAPLMGKILVADAALTDEIEAEHARIEAVQEALKSAKLAEVNQHLVTLMKPILAAESAQKLLAARLSYGDLVSHTGGLLIDPGAAWILYKLDGGIDHLLLDEVQDTAPAQWEIADAIASEFFAGVGAQEQKRSIFAVGDAKQSIFSFQGADLESFELYRNKFRARVRGAGAGWLDGKLSVSFRSTAPVLKLVDEVFAAGSARAGVCAGDEVLRHGVSREGQAGAVTLWPLTQQAASVPLPEWAVPDRYEHADSAKTILARDIAAYIKTRLDDAENLPSRGRRATPGDFLILVRRRDALVGAITSALKGSKIPVAGLDRMVLTEQQAVSDLLALCDALLLPENDLAFGQYLTSPLGGLSDESLMELALHRRGRLVSALFSRFAEQADWTAAKMFFEALRGRVDFCSPFTLLSEALGLLGGRSRILQRLGAEAAEPIDELLAEAQKFALAEPGSLNMFLHQLRESGASIKREAEAGGDLVRIMTVHGAKGLQAPIVILPDTTGVPEQKQNLFSLSVPQQPEILVPVFCPRTGLRNAAVLAAATRDAAAQEAEYNRLLYVALTRAEDELIICGAEGRRKISEKSWYTLVQSGFSRLAATEMDGRRIFSCAQTAPPDKVSTRVGASVAAMPGWAGSAPGWVGTPPAQETTRPERLAPSRSVEDVAKQAIAASPLGVGFAAALAARATAMEKGRAVHALLQHLPDVAVSARRASGEKFCGRIAALGGAKTQILDSVLAIIENPELAVVFGPGSRAEIPLAGVIGDVEIGGLVDRLAVTEREIWIADYKTDRAPPADADAIPEGYLKQLSAYMAICAQIYPGRAPKCVLVWTETAAVMHVPAQMLARYALA